MLSAALGNFLFATKWNNKYTLNTPQNENELGGHES
jgi:hypothetical protein